MDIRPTTPDDVERVNALLQASYPLLMGPAYESAALEAALPLMTRANPFLLSSGTYYIAEDGESLGCGGWTIGQPGTSDVVSGLGHIRHFATHPNWTGRGVGRSIYAVCEEQARLAGVRKFECFSSLNAEGFYASLGFTAVERINVPMKPGVELPGILMQRSI